MASPVGYSLLGLVIGKLGGCSTAMSPWRGYVFAAAAANSPDLDRLPGGFIGDVNHFLQGGSHALVAALIFGAAAALVALCFCRTPARRGLAGGGLHSFYRPLDLIQVDKWGLS